MKATCYAFIIGNILLLQVLAQNINNFYESDEKNVYYIETIQNYNWYESWIDCQRRDLTLLAIATPEKAQEIARLINTNFKEGDKPLLYIGAHDIEKPLHFVWAATGKEFDYTNWAEFEPKNYENGKHCVQIGVYENSTWNDVDCSLNLGYICEKRTTNEPQYV